MEIALGFVIAFAVAITGVGAGTVTAPLLILLLHVPAAASVGSALAYSTFVKAIVVPIEIARRQVNWRVLGWMLLGGLPGVAAGSLVFGFLVSGRPAGAGGERAFYAALGAIIAFSGGWQLYRRFRPRTPGVAGRTRPRLIAALMFPIAAEVGFSSSGAGAMGTIALMSFSSLDAAAVVGTDLAFAFCVTFAGAAIHFASGYFDGALVGKLVAGGALGAAAGSWVAPRVSGRQLRLALSVMLVLLGLGFCYRAMVGPAAGIEPHTQVAARIGRE